MLIILYAVLIAQKVKRKASKHDKQQVERSVEAINDEKTILIRTLIINNKKCSRP